MKKILMILVLLGIFASGVRAEGMNELREKRQEQIENRVENRQEQRNKVAENHANRLERRFKFYFERMSKIIDKFQQRLEYLKEQEKDVTKVQTKLDAAKAKLNEAQAKGEEAVTAFRMIDPTKWSEQKTQIMAARDLATAARTLYLEAKELLKTALAELKTISKPALPAASAAVNNSL